MTPLERIRQRRYTADELVRTAHLLRRYGYPSLADLCGYEIECQEAVAAYHRRRRAMLGR